MIRCMRTIVRLIFITYWPQCQFAPYLPPSWRLITGVGSCNAKIERGPRTAPLRRNGERGAIVAPLRAPKRDTFSSDRTQTKPRGCEIRIDHIGRTLAL